MTMAESTRSMAEVKAGDLASNSPNQIACTNCDAVNSYDKKFCGNCGRVLWQPCLSCSTKNPVDLAYCGNCGISLAEFLQKKKDETKDKLARGKQLCKEGYFSQAINLLQTVADLDDDRFRDDAQTAKSLIPKIEEQEQVTTENVRKILDQVTKKIDSKQLTVAKQLIEKIPIGLRDQNVVGMLQDLSAELVQVTELRKEIKQALAAKQFRDLLPKANRLAELHAPDDQLQQLIRKLERFESNEAVQDATTRLSEAKTLISKGDYHKAAERLAPVSPEHCGEHEKAYHAMKDTCWMYDQIVKGVRTTPALGKIVQRFQKSAPPETSNKFVQEYNKRSKQTKPDSRTVYPVWVKPKSDPLLGPSVAVWSGFANCEVSEEASISFRKNYGRFVSAFGLALQGVGLAGMPTNLLPTSRSFFRKSSAKNEAWGIEIGTSGVKAVQIARGKGEGEVYIQQALYSPIDQSPNDAEGTDRSIALTRCLEQLEATADMTTDTAVVSISGMKTLGRFFDMPRLKGKKQTEAIRYEAKVQIPIPVDQIEFDYHVWDSDDGTLQSVGLIAARKDVISETVELFEDSAFVPFQINSSCIAVYNAACFELREEIAQGLTFGVLDIGVDSSNLVIGNHEKLRFRTVPFGTEKLNQVIADGLKVNRQKAEQLRRQHGETIRSHQVDSLMSEPLGDFTQEIGRTLSGFSTEGIAVDKLFITGGGAAQHGMERFLVLGN